MSNVKLFVLLWAIVKLLCRELNIWERIKTADLLSSIREAVQYEAASPDLLTTHFQRILTNIHIYLSHID